MKFIVKTEEPSKFREWKGKANEDWQPTYATLQNPEKRALHETLLREQGAVCCYCGRNVTLDNSHIEHFRPQEHWEELALDYANLHCSCIRDTSPGMPLHCGHRKGCLFDEEKVISPMDAGCEKRFFYTLLGKVGALDDGAKYMVALLGLDIEFLANRREEVLRGVFDDDFVISATAQELETIRDRFRHPEDGVSPHFGHVVARYADQLLAVAS
jgi:uncharacterized protein (TIGR02646 family)